MGFGIQQVGFCFGAQVFLFATFPAFAAWIYPSPSPFFFCVERYAPSPPRRVLTRDYGFGTQLLLFSSFLVITPAPFLLFLFSPGPRINDSFRLNCLSLDARSSLPGVSFSLRPKDPPYPCCPLVCPFAAILPAWPIAVVLTLLSPAVLSVSIGGRLLPATSTPLQFQI